MKKRKIKWIIFLLAVVAALPLLLGISVVLLPPQYDGTYLGEMKEKNKRLKSIQGRKLIVAGGSSVAFGIRSDLMEEQLGIPVVNWGLYAPLGSRTMLEACFDEIGEGDLVVFSPEQNPETLSLSFQPDFVWQAMDGDFSWTGRFREEELKQLLGAFPKFAVSKIKYAVQGKPRMTGIYQKNSFNEYGDISASGREGNRMEDGYDSSQMIDFSFFPEEEFLRYLNEYAHRVRKKGAEFYYRFCPMNQSAILNGKNIDEWFLRLDGQAEFTILGNPHQSVMDSGWFFDTNFHLNEAGAVVNTYYFVRDIKAQQKDSSVTDIKLPVMPEETAEMDEKGDDSDGECFLYEKSDGNLVITGVKKEAQKRKELTFPYMHDGCRITAIKAGSLKECKKLKRVNVYGGITLHDGCFEGCTGLQKIVLFARPAQITVGKDLLRGTSAAIYTKYENEYRLDYSWGIYSGKIKKYQEAK